MSLSVPNNNLNDDWIKSDYCAKCDGKGFILETLDRAYPSHPEQCAECEELHQKELRADRLMDEAKGN